MQRLAILGSTGSIGTQALEVIAANRDKFSVTALAALQNDVLLEAQMERFRPDMAVLLDLVPKAERLQKSNHIVIFLAGDGERDRRHAIFRMLAVTQYCLKLHLHPPSHFHFEGKALCLAWFAREQILHKF